MKCVCGYDTDTQFMKFPKLADSEGKALPFLKIVRAELSTNDSPVDLLACPHCGTIKIDLSQGHNSQ
jgi:hypothetical protein